MNELELEKQNLEHTLEVLDKVLEAETEKTDETRVLWRREPERYEGLLLLYEGHLKALEKSLEKPYFARIDFEENGSKTQKLYIGKHGFDDENNNPVVVDWRAPISSLYYDSEVGKCSYKAPAGIIEGNLNLKRQFDIQNREILSYYDVDIVSRDALLQKYLNENNTARIKNIVSTIQKEQNDIIRRPISDNIVVQGVAGSGKTTIALHRIAYLVYTYKDIIKPNEYLVIGPNQVFMKYINSVLPDLDVNGVSQYTFEDFCMKYINDKYTITDSSKKLSKYINKEITEDVDKFKNSLKYKNMLNLFIDEYIGNVVTSDLKVGSFIILSKEELLKIYEEVLQGRENLNMIFERFILMTSTHILNERARILNRLNKHYFRLFEETIDKTKKNAITKELNLIKSELVKGCKNIIRKSLDKYKLTPLQLYKRFLNNITKYNYSSYEQLKSLKDTTLNNIKNEQVDFEDLAALLYLKFKISDCKELLEIRHTIIDEAQDLGEFNYSVLKDILGSSTFSIFGDLAQSIYEYRGVDTWCDVDKVISGVDILNFNKSYRTTDEIMCVANKIAKHLNLNEAELTVRHGDDVEFIKVNKIDFINKIKDTVSALLEKGNNTVAIVCKNEGSSLKLNEALKKVGLDIPNLTLNGDVTDDKFKICTVPCSLVKGLEFDGVIVADVSEDNYSSQDVLDMKLLYVAITRALHNVVILYDEEISLALKKS